MHIHCFYKMTVALLAIAALSPTGQVEAQRVLVQQVGGFNANIWRGGPRMGIVFRGDLAFLGGESFYVADVTKPRSPRVIGSCQLEGPARDVAIRKDHAFVAAGEAGLIILDISNPRKPKEVSFFATPFNTRCVEVRDNVAYVGQEGSPGKDNGAMLILDVANPLQPKQIASFDEPRVVRDVAVHGDLAYVGDRAGRLWIVDVSDTTSQQLVSETRGLGEVMSVRLDGTFVHTSDNDSGYHIVDVTDRTRPRKVATVKCDGLGRLPVRTVGESGEVSIERRPAPGLGSDVAPDGRYAWVTGVTGRVALIDHSDKRRPHVVGLFDTRLRAYGVTVRGHYAYVNCDRGRLVVLQHLTGRHEIRSAARAWIDWIVNPDAIHKKVAGSFADIGADAVPALIAGMHYPRRDVRNLSTHAISFIQPHKSDVGPVTDAWVGAITNRSGKFDASPLHYCRSVFTTTDLPQASQARILDALIEQLRDPNEGVRQMTVKGTLLEVGRHNVELQKLLVARLNVALERSDELQVIAQEIKRQLKEWQP